MPDACVFCGAQDGDGYCVNSPDGSHHLSDAVPNPDSHCPECGEELDRAVLDGYADHVCEPNQREAYQKWLETTDWEEDAA